MKLIETKLFETKLFETKLFETKLFETKLFEKVSDHWCFTGADASSEGFQHSQDHHRRPACLHGSHWGPISCPGCSSQEGH